jgi:hypothetical protein
MSESTGIMHGRLIIERENVGGKADVNLVRSMPDLTTGHKVLVLFSAPIFAMILPFSTTPPLLTHVSPNHGVIDGV